MSLQSSVNEEASINQDSSTDEEISTNLEFLPDEQSLIDDVELIELSIEDADGAALISEGDLLVEDPADSLEIDSLASSMPEIVENSSGISSALDETSEFEETELDTQIEFSSSQEPVVDGQELSTEQQETLPANQAVLDVLAGGDNDSLQIVFIDLSVDGYEDLVQDITSLNSQVTLANPPASFAAEGDLFDANATNAAAQVDDFSLTLGEDNVATNHSLEDAENGPQIVVYFIDPSVNGIEEITHSLGNHDDVDAVHILSHGAAGAINLGNSRLTNNNVSQYQNELMAWGESLEQDADILIYGCEVGAHSDGISLLMDTWPLVYYDL